MEVFVDNGSDLVPSSILIGDIIFLDSKNLTQFLDSKNCIIIEMTIAKILNESWCNIQHKLVAQFMTQQTFSLNEGS